eukprot:TRINITY_DN19079_c0_g1_i1.p1 TRINITY_DN19079_c0_g1~~TRINITY_DN19079_c0_g1_i1.p1  ORF type:complete len:515 (-),score=94.98 TRINITY_DN19079_c0_g1_i1:143-1687(-)
MGVSRLVQLWRTPSFFHMLPAVLMFTFAFALFNPSLTILLVAKACEELDAQDCDEAQVTGYTSKWMVYAATANSVIPALAAGTLGILSDRYGRRLALLVPCIGQALQAGLIIIFARYNLPFWWIIVAGFLGAVTGGSGTVFCGFFSYVADVSDNNSHRSLLFAVLAAVQDIGILFGNLAVGKFIEWWGLEAPFWPVCGVFIFLSLYMALVPESLTEEKKSKEELNWKKVNVFASLKGVWQESRIGPSYVQGLLASIFTFSYMSFIGFVIIVVLYAKQLFHWGPTEISHFAAAQSGLRSVGVLILAPLLFRVNKTMMPTSLVISFSLVAQTLAYSLYSVARTTKAMFIGTAFEGLSAVAIPTMRAVFSRANPETEQGRVLSAISAIETIINTAIPILIPLLFSVTNAHCPRCTTYAVAASSGIAFLISIVYGRLARPLPPRGDLAMVSSGDVEGGKGPQVTTDGMNIQQEKSALITKKERGQSCPYIQLNNDADPRSASTRAMPSYGTVGAVQLP